MTAPVEAWWIDADAVDAAGRARLQPLLSSDERARMGRYRFDRDRRRFLVRRGVLRVLLGRRLGTDPAGLRLVCNAWGKPALTGGDLRFSLSHSHGRVLYVLARGREVGCDLERRDATLASLTVAERLFAPAEVRALQALAPDRRAEGFFNCWTRKEAYVKALGLGLSLPLDAFEVTLARGTAAVLGRPGEGWTMRPVELGEPWHACVVARGDDRLPLALAPVDTTVFE